jgi:oligopeptide transport system substrate-binding protein
MRLLAVFVVLLGTLLGGCGSSGADREVPAPVRPEAQRVLRVNLGSEPRTLDPTLVTDLVGSIALGAIMEPLVSNDTEGQPIPRVAESWEHDEAYRTWTFKLRPNAKWHNGDPVVAGDFVYGVQRILTRSVGAQYATYVKGFLRDGEEYYAAGGLDGTLPLTSVEALDDHTLRYHLLNPTPHFISVIQLFSWLPINRSVVEHHGDAWANSPATYVGNGPYRLEKMRSNDVIIATPAPGYWDAANMFWERVELYMIENETTENGAFLAGELDITINVSIPEMDFWRSRPEFRLYRFFGTQYININHQRAPFDDPRVRRAFSLAIDRDHLVQRVTRRNEIIAQGIVASPLASARGGDWRDHADDYVGGYNPELARQLLAEAGFGPGGKPFPNIEYMYNTSEENKAVAEQLQAMWREALGIEVRLQNVEFGVRLSRAQRGDYDISLSGWYGDYLDAMTFLELFISNSSYNVAFYKNPKYDELVGKARVEEDAIKREALMVEAEKIIIGEDMAIIPLYYLARPILVRRDLEGVVREPTGGLVYITSRRVTEP